MRLTFLLRPFHSQDAGVAQAQVAHVVRVRVRAPDDAAQGGVHDDVAVFLDSDALGAGARRARRPPRLAEERKLVI